VVDQGGDRTFRQLGGLVADDERRRCAVSYLEGFPPVDAALPPTGES